MYDPKRKVPEVTKAASYTANGQYFETTYAAECYAIREVGKTFACNPMTIKDNNGEVHATACRIENGVALVFYDGGVRKYKDVQTFYDSEGKKEVATVALCHGHIVRLDEPF